MILPHIVPKTLEELNQEAADDHSLALLEKQIETNVRQRCRSNYKLHCL